MAMRLNPWAVVQASTVPAVEDCPSFFAVNGGNAQTLIFSGTSLNVDVSAFFSLSRTMRLDM